MSELSRDLLTLWDETLQEVSVDTSPANKAWFRDTFITTFAAGTITVGAPSIFVRDYLRDKFGTAILRILREKEPGVRGVNFSVTHRTPPNQAERIEKEKMRARTPSAVIPLDEYYVDRSDNLNPKYQFESFVVGPFNQLAHAAAKAVVERPGIVYNPLFIYGQTGHGKTHLTQAVGNSLKKRGLKVFYVTSERFAVDYFNAIQSGNANKFKDTYRAYDAIIIDDIQFLSYKDKTQEELFHLFNAFHDLNKQIVFSSDIHPALLEGLEDRLRSRFNQGMIIDIPKPDLESRTAIISAKLAHRGISLDDNIVAFIAKSLDGNIRELEGMLNSVIIQSEVAGKPLSYEAVKGIVEVSLKPRTTLSVRDIVEKIAKLYNLTIEDLHKKTRQKDIMRPRQLIMYILREDFQISFPNIGAAMGGRDHSTVIHSCERIKEDLKTDETLPREINRIRDLFR
ncbi:chromosomal replication initiator protein DnaA [Candidatus Kaiserbacteria bacterium RIFCSPHIGHO2_02_FULL_49_34]|uniref:Chromosomal replication initiator protein DnaA n=1 Tax=Candidatus Kaiserbacteria bacterium RIFCSPHIGHO2_02_FULL_49_34 TaxID=1798491 RepID=A0A1F6DJI2_9BACT|nr:MAG: chromosomal replication initiator protein DnaA [Candidatus Kaiserbacteria bacterium RIFCSPHIGHO2_02_FULL_49_34]